MIKTSSKVQIRNKTLFKLTKGINKKRILGIAIDTGKDFHVVALFDFNGKLLKHPLSINSLKSGYVKLKNQINDAKKRIKARQIIIGIEIVHIYAEALTRQLKKDYKNVFFINPFATASNRNQKLLMGLKTDAIDAASIADLLIRGECYPYNYREGLYLELKEKTYWREKKLKMIVSLKNQIINNMNRIYPGLNSKFEENKPLFTYALRGDISDLLLDLLMTPDKIANLNPQDLEKRCAQLGYSIKIKKSRKIIDYFKKMLAPSNDIASIYLKLLKRDIKILRFLENELREVGGRMIELAKQTPAKILFNQIKGLSEIMIASYVGCMGNVNHYSHANKIYAIAGLAPKIAQSGSNPGKKLGITKKGNKSFRNILYKMANRVAIHEPYFRSCRQRIKKMKSKKEATIAVANKLNKTMFAMMKKHKPFSPPAAENSERIRGENPSAMDRNSQTTD